MRVLIIEDEAPAARRLQKLLKESGYDIEVLAEIESIEQAVRWLESNTAPDLILMDIELADGLSFEIFSQTVIYTPVIFTTAYDEYALQAFKVQSIDYLLKPIDIQELKRSLAKFSDLKQHFSSASPQFDLSSLMQAFQNPTKEYKSRFLVKLGDRLIPVATNEVAYFQAEEKIVVLVTIENKKFAVDYSLDWLEQELNPKEFYRLNRQYITHLQAIKGIHQYFNGKLKINLQPDTKSEVTVSREKSAEFKRWLEG
jgi:DNA-binding LytR/AlgR family response regulator